jgi:hypothetical protein
MELDPLDEIDSHEDASDNSEGDCVDGNDEVHMGDVSKKEEEADGESGDDTDTGDVDEIDNHEDGSDNAEVDCVDVNDEVHMGDVSEKEEETEEDYGLDTDTGDQNEIDNIDDGFDNAEGDCLDGNDEVQMNDVSEKEEEAEEVSGDETDTGEARTININDESGLGNEEEEECSISDAKSPDKEEDDSHEFESDTEQQVQDVPAMRNGRSFVQAYYSSPENDDDELEDELDEVDAVSEAPTVPFVSNGRSRLQILDDSDESTKDDDDVMEDEEPVSLEVMDMATLTMPVLSRKGKSFDMEIFDRHAIGASDHLHVIADLDYLGHTHESTPHVIRSCKHDVCFTVKVPLRLSNAAIMDGGRIRIDCDGDKFQPVGTSGNAVGRAGVPLHAFKNIRLCKVTTSPNIEFSVSVFMMNQEFVPTDPHCSNETLTTIALVMNTVKNEIHISSAFRSFETLHKGKARELTQTLKATAPFRVLTSTEDSQASLNLEGYQAQVFFEAYQEVLYKLAMFGVIGAMERSYLGMKGRGEIICTEETIQAQAIELCFSSLTHATCAGLKHKLMEFQPEFNIMGDKPKEFHRFSQDCLNEWKGLLRDLSDVHRNEPFWSQGEAEWLISKETAPVTTLDMAFRISYINKEGEAMSLLIDGRKGAGQCSAQRRCEKDSACRFSRRIPEFDDRVQIPEDSHIKFDRIFLALKELSSAWNTHETIPTQVWEELQKSALQPKFFAELGVVTDDETQWDMDRFDWDDVSKIDTSYTMSFFLNRRHQNRGLRRRQVYPEREIEEPFEDSEGEESEPDDPMDEEYVPDISTEPDNEEIQHIFDRMYDVREDADGIYNDPEAM